MAGTEAATSSPRVNPLRTALARLAVCRPEELATVMARREALRALPGGGAGQGLVGALLGAGFLCLLIPLHRAFGDRPGRPDAPYFLLFALGVQIALMLLAARAVWAGMRQDAAAGSVDELVITGASVSQILLGKWLGVCAAALAWTLMLTPLLLLAAAFTGTPLPAALAVAICWAASAAIGALAGTLLSFSEQGPVHPILPGFMVLPFWFMFRWVLPRAGLGPAWTTLMGWMRDADPVTLVPAALGVVHEPVALKLATLAVLAAVAVFWLADADRELPLRANAPLRPEADFFSLRPVRSWMTGRRVDGAPVYDRDVLYPFERVYGWRLRISPEMWLCILGVAVIPAVIIAIAGREQHQSIVALLTLQAGVAASVGALGMAASLAAEREQGRWTFLLCAPLTEAGILLAKWRAVCAESWPLWAAMPLTAALNAAAGSLPWSAVPVAALAGPVAAGAAAGVVAALCVRTPSLTAAQQRAVLVLVAPVVAVASCHWLLPHLRGPGYLSLPHLLYSALQFRPSFAGPAEGLAALAGYALLGAAGLALAVWQLRRWPPI